MTPRKRMSDKKRRPRKIEQTWTPSDIKKIILLVEQREVLWDYSLPGYKDAKIRETTFQEIADALERTVSDCKAKWDNLRAQYRGYQAKAIQNYVVKWQYFESMHFLSRVCEPRKSMFNVVLLPPSAGPDQFLEDMDTESSCSSSTQLTVKQEGATTTSHRIKDVTTINESTVQEKLHNSEQIFGDFVADQMRQLKQTVADELKKNILKLVVEAMENNN